MSRATNADLKFLVADHAPHMAYLIADMLRSLGARRIIEVTSASEVLSALHQDQWNILLLDNDLKDADSVAMVRQLRTMADCPNQQVAIIMMASSPGLQRITDARDAGVNEFLRKPFAPSHLASRIDSILKAPRPFMATNNYVGPDRRRRRKNFYGNDRRRDQNDALGNDS